MSWKRVLYVTFVVIVAGISGLSGAFAGGLAVYRALSTQTTSVAAPPGTAVPLQAESVQQLHVSSTDVETTITDAVAQVGQAVVTVVGTIPGQNTFFGRTSDQQVSGSGVFISSDGYVLTNNHVVEGTQQAALVLADSQQIPAKIVGKDRYADLAVLKADHAAPGVAKLGNSDTLKAGETVIAIGSPLGDFKNTVTVGVVSATGRAIDTGEGYRIEDLIQTDAAINSGNSGGPLLNLAGEVVGINTLVVRGSGFGGTIAEGLGFAIPVNTARAVAEQITQKGYFSRPYLGIRWQLITPNIAAAYNLPVRWGVYITDVYPDGPGVGGVLQRGDIITQIGDVSLDEEHSFINALFNYQPGDTINLELVRNGRRLQQEVTLGESRSD
jgi:2-alkenal reductase